MWGGSGEGKTTAELVTMGLLVYVPPQLFWLAMDFGTRNSRPDFFAARRPLVVHQTYMTDHAKDDLKN